MVQDDDSYQTWDIDPALEPLEYCVPHNDQIKAEVLKFAQAYPGWGRLRIHEELRERGVDVHEAEVNWVLDRYRMPNLRL